MGPPRPSLLHPYAILYNRNSIFLWFTRMDTNPRWGKIAFPAPLALKRFFLAPQAVQVLYWEHLPPGGELPAPCLSPSPLQNCPQSHLNSHNHLKARWAPRKGCFLCKSRLTPRGRTHQRKEQIWAGRNKMERQNCFILILPRSWKLSWKFSQGEASEGLK